MFGLADELDQGVFCGDAFELAAMIEPETVDLILTDPVYGRVDDYELLAEIAASILKPDSALLAFASKQHTHTIRERMGKYLDFVWQLDYIIKAKTTRLWAYNVFMWNTPVVWFAKGKGYPLKTIPDTYIGNNGAVHGGHKWNKNLGVLRYWINAFTRPGDIVLDPFCGGGSTLVAAKESGRRWLGFEIDPETAVAARERVAMAQVPAIIEDMEGYQICLEV